MMLNNDKVKKWIARLRINEIFDTFLKITYFIQSKGTEMGH